MSISEKIKAINNKTEENKTQYSLTGKLLRIQLYHQEIPVNMSFGLADIFCQKKACWK